MNKILEEVKRIIGDGIKEYLPKVKAKDLEENGMVYYMNGNDGTEFDWYVNGRLPEFMAFYNDKKNLGVAKLNLYANGEAEVYLYDNHGEDLCKSYEVNLNFTEEEMFELAVILKCEADEKSIWDKSIEIIESDIHPNEEKINEFKDAEENFKAIKEKIILYNSRAIVSRRILDENWKVGFMIRDEQAFEGDSGWSFYAGNEEDSYTAEPSNFVPMTIQQVCQIDPDVMYYVENPAGSSFIRSSSEDFIMDDPEKEIFMEKRK